MLWKVTKALMILLGAGSATSFASDGAQGAELSRQLPPLKISGACGDLKTNFAVIYDGQDTTSATYVDVTGAKINFTSTNPGCVIATFSGVATFSTIGQMDVHVLLDDSTVCDPENYAFAQNTNAEAHSMTAVCKDVAAGSHTIKVQFISVFGGTVHIGARTFTVGHK
jgi:hypothetical protein